MVRYLRTHKQRTRARILQAATRLFKTGGYHRVGVDAIMNAEGLTAGGFYAHFESKEMLLSEIFDLAFGQTKTQLLAGFEDREGVEWLREAVRRYLGRPHRDHAAEGCPLPALSADVARSNDRVRATFQMYLESLVGEFERKLSSSVSKPNDRALAAIALCVGGVLLARAVRDRDLSDRILAACRHHNVVHQTAGDPD